MLNDEKLSDLFYKEYREERAETDALYKRCQVAIASLALLAGIVSAITRSNLLSEYWLRIDVFLYYTFVGLVGLSLVCATACFTFSIKPRDYQYLENLEIWCKWRDQYRKEVTDSAFGISNPALVDEVIAKATCNQMITRLSQAADWNASQNRVKVLWFNRGFYFAVSAMIAIAFVGLMHAVLFFNQVKVP